uniref:Reverse transcriptase N-terminal domain-containing protein n=1 Tax=Chondria sp. (in: red algae) TaxID=1982705 RepID=A0A1Z1MC81_9FLOR|nr:hypothetical protein [Chondria sp. (in: red algae)]
MLQKQIYHFTKKHNLRYVNYVQRYVINSNEAKMLAIKKTLDIISIYHFGSKSRKLIISTIQNLYILRLLFKDQLLNSKTMTTIIEITKQNLIHLLLEPCHKAKTKKDIHQQLHVMSNSMYLMSSYITKQIELIRVNRNIYINITMSRLQLPQYFSKLIISWLHSDYMRFDLKLFDLMKNNFNDDRHSAYNYRNTSVNKITLINLIFDILFSDIIWFMFITLLEANYITSNLIKLLNYSIRAHGYKCQFIIDKIDTKRSNISIQNFSYLTKSNKYIKDYKVKDTNKIIDYIYNIYCQYYVRHTKFVYFSIRRDLNMYYNIFIHNYYRKRCLKDKVSSKFIVLNYDINLYNYRHNINNYYINI